MWKKLVSGLFLVCAVCSMTVGAEKERIWSRKPQWRQAFLNALHHPSTWVPAAGAALIAIGDYVSKISDWAVRETPIFGSPSRANEASDNLLNATRFSMYATAVAIPIRKRSWQSGTERLLVDLVSEGVRSQMVHSVKKSTGRERPDGSDDLSFPSSHSSAAHTFAALASRTVEDLDLPRPAALSLTIGFRTLAAGTAWARVEAGKHYPTDVLVGAALGNFVAIFLNDAVLGHDRNKSLQLNLNPKEPHMFFLWRF